MTRASALARASLLAAGVIVAAALSPASGQPANPGALNATPQELNPAERAPPMQPNAGRNDLLAPPEPGACPLRQSDLRFTLQTVTFTGADTVPPGALQAAYAGLIGQEVPVSALCDIRDRAAVILFNRGLLARVEIPQQRIMDGRVTFEVIEAYVASVRVVGDIGNGQEKVEDYIEMLRGMRPFDLGKAQRYLLLASDVPGVRIATVLRPSSAGRGAIDLEVDVTRIPYDVIGNVQNFGSHEVGPFNLLVRGDLNSVTRFGERTSLVLSSTPDFREQRVIQGIEEMRFGADGWLGRLSLAYGDTRPGGVLAPVRIHGTSVVGSLGGSYPIVRSRRLNLNVIEGLDAVDQNVDVAGARLNQDALRVLYLGLNGDRTWLLPVPTTVAGIVTLRQGIDAFGASRKGAALLSHAEADPSAFVLRGDGHIIAALLPALSVSLRVVGQYADHALLAYEEMPVGNLTIGRGYDPSALSGDSGIGGTLQFDLGDFPIPYKDGNVGAVGFFAFTDIARVENYDRDQADRTVRSVGLGAAWQLFDRFRLELTYAHPIDKVSETALKRPGDRLLLNLIVRS